MTRDEIRARDTERLKALHPVLRTKVSSLLAAMDALGFPMCVTAGARTAVEQQKLFAQGRASPGAIVTNADGVTKLSNHQVNPVDGWGHAADCAFLVDGPDHDNELDTPTWDPHRPWGVYGAAAEALGLRWGGRFQMRDMPHVELA